MKLIKFRSMLPILGQCALFHVLRLLVCEMYDKEMVAAKPISMHQLVTGDWLVILRWPNSLMERTPEGYED